MSAALTTHEAAQMSADALRRFAASCENRQLSLFATRYAAAKDAAAIGDIESARKYLESAKTAYRRSLEDAHGQELRVRATAAVVESRGDAAECGVGGKNVFRTEMRRGFAVWQDSWAASGKAAR